MSKFDIGRLKFIRFIYCNNSICISNIESGTFGLDVNIANLQKQLDRYMSEKSIIKKNECLGIVFVLIGILLLCALIAGFIILLAINKK